MHCNFSPTGIFWNHQLATSAVPSSWKARTTKWVTKPAVGNGLFLVSRCFFMVLLLKQGWQGHAFGAKPRVFWKFGRLWSFSTACEFRLKACSEHLRICKHIQFWKSAQVEDMRQELGHETTSKNFLPTRVILGRSHAEHVCAGSY